MNRSGVKRQNIRCQRFQLKAPGKLKNQWMIWPAKPEAAADSSLLFYLALSLLNSDRPWEFLQGKRAAQMKWYTLFHASHMALVQKPRRLRITQEHKHTSCTLLLISALLRDNWWTRIRSWPRSFVEQFHGTRFSVSEPLYSKNLFKNHFNNRSEIKTFKY